MKLHFLFVLSVVLFFEACQPASTGSSIESAEAKIIRMNENQKYKLKCNFYGESIEGGGEDEKVVSYITILDGSSRQEVKYTPIDGDSLVLEKGYFTDVWSPDEEFLLLPRGRFDGFCIIKSADAVQSITDSTCLDYVMVELKNGTRLWHEFERWDGVGAFRFKAGLSGERVEFKYEISSQRLTVLGQNNNTFEGKNSKGKINISSN